MKASQVKRKKDKPSIKLEPTASQQSSLPVVPMGEEMEATKVAIVTGSSRGIGAETALLLAKNGYAVCVNYVSNSESAEHVANQITSNGGRSLAGRADESSANEEKKLFKTVDAEVGGVTVIVNNFGIYKRQ